MFKSTAKKQQGGFGFGHLLTQFLNLSQWSEPTAMVYNPVSIQPINPDPRILTTLVIGTEDNVRAHILRQHTLGVAEAGAWSRPLVPNCPDKVMCPQPHHGLTSLKPFERGAPRPFQKTI